MNETDYLKRAMQTLDLIENTLDAGEEDLDCLREGDVLTLELGNGKKLVVSLHTSTREIWLATPAGGFHYRFENEQWRNLRHGKTLQEDLANALQDNGINAVFGSL